MSVIGVMLQLLQSARLTLSLGIIATIPDIQNIFGLIFGSKKKQRVFLTWWVLNLPWRQRTDRNRNPKTNKDCRSINFHCYRESLEARSGLRFAQGTGWLSIASDQGKRRLSTLHREIFACFHNRATSSSPCWQTSTTNDRITSLPDRVAHWNAAIMES